MFTDGEACWFNVAKDLAPGADSADSSARHAEQQRQHERQRAGLWFRRMCHVVAHSWCAAHDAGFADAYSQVVLQYSRRFEQEFGG